jgi:hypothetical protein
VHRSRRKNAAGVDPPDPLAPVPWKVRTITLIGDRAETDRICRDWTEHGWNVMTVDAGAPTSAGHPTHVVRLAVPPHGLVTELPTVSS